MIPASCAFFTVESRSADSTDFTVSSFLASVLGASVVGLASVLGTSTGLATSVVAGVEGFTSSADTLLLPKAIPNIASAKITPHAPNFVLRIEP